MKVYIVSDLEGVAGVVDFKKQCMEDGAYYQQAINMATRELNALIEGVIEGGATEIFAWPGHGAFPGGINVELYATWFTWNGRFGRCACPQFLSVS